jgi:uncharacterized metal-binding protein
MYTCAYCTKQACMVPDKEAMPKNCPCLNEELVEESRKKYEPEDVKKLAVLSCETEYEGYCRRTRIEEIMEFAEKMEYKTIGLVHCVGFIKEAKLTSDIFRANGFKVVSICCKGGTTSKAEMDMGQYQLNLKYEGMCNPIGQAMAVEQEGCDLAVIEGLCVGHDTLFLKHCNIPVTYLIVKDRVTGHNPAAAIYTSEGYYKRRLYPPTRLRGDIGEKWPDTAPENARQD